MSLRAPFETPIADRTGRIDRAWARHIQQLSEPQMAIGKLAASFVTASLTSVSSGFGVKAPLAQRGRLLIGISNLILQGVGVAAFLMRTVKGIPIAGSPLPATDVIVSTISASTSIIDQPLDAASAYSYYLALSNGTLAFAAATPLLMTVTEF